MRLEHLQAQSKEQEARTSGAMKEKRQFSFRTVMKKRKMEKEPFRESIHSKLHSWPGRRFSRSITIATVREQEFHL